MHVARDTHSHAGQFGSEAGRDDLADDPRYQTNRGRVEHREELVPELRRLIVTRSVEEWTAVLERANVPGGPVLSIPETFAGPAAHMVERVQHPAAGEIGLVRSPIALEGERPGRRIPPPRLGDHGDELLAEIGYDEAERRSLLAGACSPGGG